MKLLKIILRVARVLEINVCNNLLLAKLHVKTTTTVLFMKINTSRI